MSFYSIHRLYIEQHFKETCLFHYDCNNKFVINPTNHTHIQNCESLLQLYGFWQWQRLWESWLLIPGHCTLDWFSLDCLMFESSFFHALSKVDIRQPTFSKHNVHTAWSLWKTNPWSSAHEGWNARAFGLLAFRLPSSIHLNGCTSQGFMWKMRAAPAERLLIIII